MERYDFSITDDVVFVETPEGTLRVGTVDALRAATGGGTHDVKYDHRQAAMPWHDLPERTLSVDVREWVETMDAPRALVETLASLDGGDVQNERVEYLARVVDAALSEQGQG
jgi:hypothetical protein